MRYALASLIPLCVLLTSCPLPYDFSGEGSGTSTTDPSTPRITAPVTVTYAEQGGTSGVVPAPPASITTTRDTTVTLATETEDAVILPESADLTAVHRVFRTFVSVSPSTPSSAGTVTAPM